MVFSLIAPSQNTMAVQAMEKDIECQEIGNFAPPQQFFMVVLLVLFKVWIYYWKESTFCQCPGSPD